MNTSCPSYTVFLGGGRVSISSISALYMETLIEKLRTHSDKKDHLQMSKEEEGKTVCV